MIAIITCMASIWLMLYNSTFSKIRTRYFIMVGIFARFAGTYVYYGQMKYYKPDDTTYSTERSKLLFSLNAILF